MLQTRSFDVDATKKAYVEVRALVDTIKKSLENYKITVENANRVQENTFKPTMQLDKALTVELLNMGAVDEALDAIEKSIIKYSNNTEEAQNSSAMGNIG